MALIVENGTGVVDANGYITVAFADTYFADRGNDNWVGPDSVKSQAIIQATDYMESQYANRWKGIISPDATTLSFPRDYFYDRKGTLIDFAADGIPTDIQKACAELALRSLSGDLYPDPVVDDDSGKQIKWLKEKVGPIETETEFVVGKVSTKKTFPVVLGLLKFWLRGGGGVYR